jgi:hypothetical protein
MIQEINKMEIQTYGHSKGRALFKALRKKLTTPTEYIPINMGKAFTPKLRRGGLLK